MNDAPWGRTVKRKRQGSYVQRYQVIETRLYWIYVP